MLIYNKIPLRGILGARSCFASTSLFTPSSSRQVTLHNFRTIYLPIILSSTVLLFCAHQIPPSGGPVDLVSPSIVSTSPAQGSTGVHRTGKITFLFSKWIATANIKRCVSISPPLQKGFKVNVAGRRLEITPISPLADSTTYHVEINSTLNDLHNNSIGTPYHLIFSTGSSLDSAQLYGCVIDPARRVLQPKLALFHLGADSLIRDSVLFTVPDYLVQTDSSGSFHIDHIRRALYRVIAFIDDNNHGRLDPGKEQAYAPESPIVKTSATPETLMLFPVRSDTALPRVQTVRAISKKILFGQWRPAIDPAFRLSSPQWKIESIDHKNAHVPLVDDYILFLDKSRFALVLKDTLSVLSYRLIYSFGRIGDSASHHDTLRFNGVNVSDTTHPALGSWSPVSQSEISPVLRIIWTKPVLLNTTSFQLADSLHDSLTVSTVSSYSDTSIFQLSRHLQPQQTYRLTIPLTAGQDLLGNSFARRDSLDSAGYRISISTIAADSLAFMLKGGSSCLKADPLRVWQFKPFIGGHTYTSHDSAGTFRFDSIPAGKGFVSYFRDLDGDGKPSPGNLVPWKAPEPYIPLYDTIEARARWEIEGLSVPGCDACGKRVTHEPAAAAPTPGNGTKGNK